jgi:DNA-3-methyladenine glycosylase II
MSTIIENDEHVAEGLAALAALDPLLLPVIDAAGALPLRRRSGGFEGLAGIIVAQQLSVASARAIWGKVEAYFSPLTPEAILAASEPDFRACGLSAPKIRTMRAIAAAIAEGTLPVEALAGMETEAARTSLTGVKGIGPWTADIYLMFCLGHADVFAPGDLALQEAVKMAYGLEARPDAKALALFAERWKPWRAVAARLLWAYYGAMKKREGAPTPS